MIKYWNYQIFWLVIGILLMLFCSNCKQELTPEEQIRQNAMVEKLSYVKHKDFIELKNGQLYMVARALEKEDEKKNWRIVLKQQHYAHHDYRMFTLAMIAPEVKEIYYRGQEAWSEAAAHYLW